MKAKKLVLVAVAALSVAGLTACSSDSIKDKDIITMKGDTVRMSDLYKESKANPSVGSATLLQNITFSKMFEKDFSKQVTKDDVNKEFDKQKAQYGDQFAAALQQSGMTEASLKESIRLRLLEDAVLNKDIKDTQYTKANLESAWKDYHSEVSAIVVAKPSEDEAKKLIEENTADAKKFDETYKKSEAKFDSASTTIPADVQAAAYKLKDGEVSPVITSTTASTGASTYYVVKMVKTSDKGTDMNKHKSALENIIKTGKMTDTAYVSSVIGKYLKKDNVTVKETDYASIFSQFTTTPSSSTKTSSSK